ncbi:site-specific integrase [soil metagenome]
MAKAKRQRRVKGEGTIYQRHDGIWYASITVGYDEDGKQIRKYVSGGSQAEVRAKIDKLKGQLATGTLSTTKISVGDYLSQWLEFKRLEVKPRTHQFLEDYVRLYVRPHLARIELAKLSPLHVQNMLQNVAQRVSHDAANKARSVLGSALRRAVRLGLIPRNPVDAVDKLKHDTREVSLWTPEVTMRFLDAASSHRLYAAFYLALSTGMRHGEVLGLRWQDVQDDVITVRQAVVNVRGASYRVSTPKTRKGVRQVAIGPDTVRVLREHRRRQKEEERRPGKTWRNSGLVFVTRFGGVITPRNFDRVWYGLQARAKVPRIRFHDLRHLHVSLLIQLGLDPRTVADRVGHTDPSFTLRRYSHMFEAQRRAAAVPLPDMLGQGDEGELDEGELDEDGWKEVIEDGWAEAGGDEDDDWDEEDDD